MGRIRSIKPAFFLDEDLCELPPLHRLLFVGLWTLADGHGRLEDRPKRIKVEILPYDNCNVEQLLEDLAKPHRGNHHFIVRYEVAGQALIELPHFRKHQRISGKESAEPSCFPGPSGEAVVKQRGSSGEAPIALEGKGREGKGKDTTSSPSAPVCAPVRPVSDEDPHAISQEASPRVCAPVPAREDEVAPSPTSEQASLPSMPSPAGAKEMREIWNEVAPAACPRWVRNSDSRSKSARARMDEHASEPGGAVAWWRRVVEKVRDSKFLRGDGSQWRADIDWMLKPANLIKVEEGKYDDRHVVGNVRTGSVRAEDMKHSEQVGVVNMDDWTGGKANG